MLTKILNKIAQAKMSAVAEPWVHLVHASIALVAVLVASLFIPLREAAAFMLVAAGVIEFWFDAKFEKQSFSDNLHDFMDYSLGVAVASVIALVAK